MKQLEVQIMGQSYLLGCPEGGEQRVRALQLLVAHEQALDAFDEGVDLGAAGHGGNCRVLCLPGL